MTHRILSGAASRADDGLRAEISLDVCLDDFSGYAVGRNPPAPIRTGLLRASIVSRVAGLLSGILGRGGRVGGGLGAVRIVVIRAAVVVVALASVAARHDVQLSQSKYVSSESRSCKALRCGPMMPRPRLWLFLGWLCPGKSSPAGGGTRLCEMDARLPKEEDE